METVDYAFTMKRIRRDVKLLRSLIRIGSYADSSISGTISIAFASRAVMMWLIKMFCMRPTMSVSLLPSMKAPSRVNGSARRRLIADLISTYAFLLFFC